MSELQLDEYFRIQIQISLIEQIETEALKFHLSQSAPSPNSHIVRCISIYD